MPSTSVASDLADQLAASQSATIYVDVELSEADAAALLLGDPPLHVEHDLVRDKWAVRAATPEEVAEAQAATQVAEAAPEPSESSSAV